MIQNHDGTKRFWIAVAVSPVVAPLLFLLIALSVGWIHIDHFAYNFDQILLALMFGASISYAAMATLGVPYLLWLRRRGRMSFGPVSLGLSFLGVVVVVAFVLVVGNPPALLLSRNLIELLSIGAFLGLSVGVVFHWGVMPRRHTNDR